MIVGNCWCRRHSSRLHGPLLVKIKPPRQCCPVHVVNGVLRGQEVLIADVVDEEPLAICCICSWFSQKNWLWIPFPVREIKILPIEISLLFWPVGTLSLGGMDWYGRTETFHSVLKQILSYPRPSEMGCPRKPTLRYHTTRHRRALSDFHLLFCFTSCWFMFLCHP